MIYVSMDLETSGRDSEKHKILEVGAIVEDTKNPLPREECPQFHAILDHSEFTGEPVALNMNKNLIEILAEYHKLHYTKKKAYAKKHNIIKPENLTKEFSKWYWTKVVGNDEDSFDFFQAPVLRINVAGKNFGTFDLQFLEKQALHWKTKIQCRVRILDPSLSLVDWENDEVLPGIDKCKERAPLATGIITHNALDDAWDIILMLRPLYNPGLLIDLDSYKLEYTHKSSYDKTAIYVVVDWKKNKCKDIKKGDTIIIDDNKTYIVTDVEKSKPTNTLAAAHLKLMLQPNTQNNK